jgi:hypothetical protein
MYQKLHNGESTNCVVGCRVTAEKLREEFTGLTVLLYRARHCFIFTEQDLAAFEYDTVLLLQFFQ